MKLTALLPFSVSTALSKTCFLYSSVHVCSFLCFLSHTHTHTHTPPLSHAAILHNSHSAFTLLPLLSLNPASLLLPFSSVHPLFSSLVVPPLQSFHFLQTCLYLYSSFILSFPSLSFTGPNGSLSTASLPLVLPAGLTCSPTHTRWRNKWPSQSLSQTKPTSFFSNAQLQTRPPVGCLSDTWRSRKSDALEEKHLQ